MERARKERFKALYEAQYHPVLAYGLRRLSVREDAEDAAAETFQIAWRRLDEIPASYQRAWLLAVARHRVLDKVRAQERRRALVGRLKRQIIRPTDLEPGADPRHDVLDALAALASLDEPDREAIMLVAWDCLSNREAAQVLDLNRAAFALRLFRARRRLVHGLELAMAAMSAEETYLPSAKERT